MVCAARSQESVCRGLAEEMRERPEVFHGLEMEYVINGQRSARRRVRVNGGNVASGRLFARMEAMHVGGASAATRF